MTDYFDVGYEDRIPHPLSVTVEPHYADKMRSGETLTSEKLNILRGYLYDALCKSIEAGTSVGVTMGKLLLPFEFDVDMESVRILVQSFINSFDDSNVALSVTVFGRNDQEGLAAFGVTWQITAP